jgi:PAS domain S-box-containing protein
LKLLGSPKEGQLCGRRFSSLLAREGVGGSEAGVPASQASTLAASLAPALVGRDLKNHIHLPEVAIERFDNRRLTVEFWSHPIVREGEDDVEGAVFTLVDITVRKQVQEELCRLRVLLSNIVDSMPSALIGVDADMRVTQWNHAAEQMFDIPADKVMGLRIDRACHPLSAEIEHVRTALQEARIERSVKVSMAVNGRERFVDVTAYPLVRKGVANGMAREVGGAVVMVDDVTERMRMEDMMVQSEKMLSVGGLAAGMAHEINNPLAGILQNIQVLRNRLQPKLPANQRAAEELGLDMERIEAYANKRGLFTMMDSVITSGRRAAKVVENMLSFSRKSDSSYAPQDLAGLLDQAVDLAGNDYDLKKKYDFRQVEMVRDYAPDLPMVACEKGQIQQVILNLLRNGCQAMCAQPDTDRPQRIILRLERVGEQVCIQVEDNGPGMDEEVAKRVFEPFFTTKAVGFGTGLGLSVSYFIITENHAGTMSVESSPGNGTCFTLCLPIRKPARPATLSV